MLDAEHSFTSANIIIIMYKCGDFNVKIGYSVSTVIIVNTGMSVRC